MHQQGSNYLLIAENSILVGILALTDSIRDSAVEAIRLLSQVKIFFLFFILY